MSVWIKFLPFVNDMWKKRAFEFIQFYKEIHGKCWGACENFSFVEVRCEYVMIP